MIRTQKPKKKTPKHAKMGEAKAKHLRQDSKKYSKKDDDE